MSLRFHLLFALVALSWGGCTSGDSSSEADDDDSDSGAPANVDASTSRHDASTSSADGSARGDASTSDPNRKVGEFSLRLIAPSASTSTPGYTHFLGIVSDGPTPDMRVWTKKDEASGCALSTPRIPFCEESCGSGVCVADDVCQPLPVAKGVGEVIVRGVKTPGGASEFKAVATNNTYQAIDQLPYPAFAEGDAIEVSAAGTADIAAFKLAGVGIAPLQVAGSDQGFALERGAGLALKWTAPAKSGSRVQVKLDISHHGGTKGMIECDVTDNGALTIPAKLTDQLLDLGFAGLPTVVVTRSAVSSTATRYGRVDLKIYEYVEADIEIDGLVSCTDTAQCPSGQRCRPDKSCGT